MGYHPLLRGYSPLLRNCLRGILFWFPCNNIDKILCKFGKSKQNYFVLVKAHVNLQAHPMNNGEEDEEDTHVPLEDNLSDKQFSQVVYRLGKHHLPKNFTAYLSVKVTIYRIMNLGAKRFVQNRRISTVKDCNPSAL